MKPKPQLSLFPDLPKLDDGVIAYASGLSTMGEIVGFAELGWNVGVTGGNCSRTPPTRSPDAHRTLPFETSCMDALRHIPFGTKVMVDSGAVKEVDRKTGRVRRQMSDQVWNNRLDFYDEVTEIVGGSRVLLIAPDRIRSQDMTLERVSRYAHRMRRLHRKGCDVLAVLQPGKMPLADFHRQIAKRLGFTPIPAFPMGARETDERAMELCLATLRPARTHFLGQGPRSKYLPEVVKIAKRTVPGIVISCDSYPLRAMKGYSQGARRPKPFTESELRTTDELRSESFGGLDTPFGGFDFTDAFESLDWLALGERFEIAKRIGMNAEDTAAWAFDPTALQHRATGIVHGDDDGDLDFDLQTLDDEIEQAWVRWVERETRNERHRRSILEVLGR